MTAETVLDAVNSIAAAAPFSLTRAIEPFSFDLQPTSNSGNLYRVEARLDDVDGYIGFAQCEYWAVDVWVAMWHQRASHTAQRSLTVAISSLTAALCRAGALQDWNVSDDELSGEIGLPPGQDDVYLVGRLSARIDFDRAL